MKKILIVSAAAAVLILMLSACIAPENAGSERYEPVTEGTLTGEMKETIEKIRYKRGYSIIGEAEGYLYVYFGSGEKPTGGYSIGLARVEESGGNRVIVIRETSPGRDDAVTEALTYPYIVLKIEKEFFEGAEIMGEVYEPFGDIGSDAEDIGITGKIIMITTVQGTATILVEGDPAENKWYDKAYVRIDGETVITIKGEKAGMDALAEGMEVTAVFKGPVAESYPVQAYASGIVAEERPGIGFETVEEEEECIQYIKMHRGFGLIREDIDHYYIFIGAGEKRTGGYEIAVKAVEKAGGQCDHNSC